MCVFPSPQGVSIRRCKMLGSGGRTEVRSRARALVQDGVQDGAGGRAVLPVGPWLTLWAREGGDARGGPLAPKVLLQRLARLPSGSRPASPGLSVVFLPLRLTSPFPHKSLGFYLWRFPCLLQGDRG